MHKIIPILIFMCCSILTYSQSNLMKDTVIYVTPEDEVLLRDKKAKYLVKLGSDASFEFKLSKAFSLEFELDPDNMIGTDSNFELGLGARYYYQMANRIAKGKQANNFSGKYISAMVSKGFYTSNAIWKIFNRSTSYTLGIGTQQRYLQREYFDFGLFLDYQNASHNGGSSHNLFTLRTESNYGFVFGKRHKLNEENLCPVIKCFQDTKTAFKINRNNLFQLSVGKTSNNRSSIFLQLAPKIGYEFKLGNSPFSIDQELQSSLNFTNYYYFSSSGIPDSFGLSEASLSYSISARYYYKMKKKILSGEQGNNLSGGYAYARFSHDFRHFSEQALDQSRGTITLGIGRQTTIVNSLFLDFKLGIGPKIYGDTFTAINELDIGDNLALDLDFTIGYIF